MQKLTNIMKGQYKKLYLNCLKSGSIQFANCKGRKFINQNELENCQTLFKYLQMCKNKKELKKNIKHLLAGGK